MEYSDELTACPTDETLLVDSILAVSLATKRRLPLSLVIVSYLYLIPGIHGFITFARGMNLVIPKIRAMDAYQVTVSFGLLLFMLAWTLIYFGVVVGLRKRSRFWHIVALLAYGYAYYSAACENMQPLIERFGHREAYYWCAVIGVGLGLVIFLWPLYVLLRRDVRGLFWNAKTDA
jgi:hypothetical protein